MTVNETWPDEAFIATRQVGDATVHAVSDGTFTWAPQLSGPEAEWRREMPEANAAGEIVLGHNMVCLRHGGAVVLIDAGLDDPSPESPWMPPRAHRSPGVQAGLARLGIRPEHVTHVVLTHAHGDHVAGATVERDGQRLARYPKARYLLGRRDWVGNPERSRPASIVAREIGTLEQAGALDLLDGETVLAPGITLVPSPGDSPGHFLVRLESGGERLYVVGDLFHHPCEVAHPNWVSPGRDPVASQRSREQFVAEAAAPGATVVFTHEHFPPWGRIVPAAAGHAGGRDGSGCRWRRDEARIAPPA